MNEIYSYFTPLFILIISWIGGYVMVSYDWIEIPRDYGYMKPVVKPNRYALPKDTRDVKQNNIVWFELKGEKDFFFGRVVGVPGDVVAMSGGKLIRNGKKIREKYVNKIAAGDEMAPIVVPAGHVFLMNDDRSEKRSALRDSRLLGPIPIAAIRGVLK